MANSKKDNLITDIDFNAQVIYHPDVDQDYLSRNVIDRLREGMHDFDNVRGSKEYIKNIAKTIMKIQMSPEMLDDLRQSPEDSLEIYNKYSIKQVEAFEVVLGRYEKQLGYKGVPEDQIQKIVSAQRAIFEKHLNNTILQQQYDYQVLLQLKDISDAKLKVDSFMEDENADPKGYSDAVAAYGDELKAAKAKFPENKEFANLVDNVIGDSEPPKEDPVNKSSQLRYRGVLHDGNGNAVPDENSWDMKAYRCHTMNTLKFGGLITVAVGGLAAALGVITFPTALIALGVSTMLSAPFAILKEKMGLSQSKISKDKFKHFDLTDSNKFVRGVAHVAMFGLQVFTIGGITSALSNAFGVGAELAGNEVAKAAADANVQEAQEVFTKAQELKEAAEIGLLEANDELLELGISQATQSSPAGVTNAVGSDLNFLQKTGETLSAADPVATLEEIGKSMGNGGETSEAINTVTHKLGEASSYVGDWMQNVFGLGGTESVTQAAEVTSTVAQTVDTGAQAVTNATATLTDASGKLVDAARHLGTMQEVAYDAAVALQGTQLGANEIATVAAIGATSQVLAERHGRCDDASKNYYRGTAVDAFDDEVKDPAPVEDKTKKQNIS